MKWIFILALIGSPLFAQVSRSDFEKLYDAGELLKLIQRLENECIGFKPDDQFAEILSNQKELLKAVLKCLHDTSRLRVVNDDQALLTNKNVSVSFVERKIGEALHTLAISRTFETMEMRMEALLEQRQLIVQTLIDTEDPISLDAIKSYISEDVELEPWFFQLIKAHGELAGKARPTLTFDVERGLEFFAAHDRGGIDARMTLCMVEPGTNYITVTPGQTIYRTPEYGYTYSGEHSPIKLQQLKTARFSSSRVKLGQALSSTPTLYPGLWFLRLEVYTGQGSILASSYHYFEVGLEDVTLRIERKEVNGIKQIFIEAKTPESKPSN